MADQYDPRTRKLLELIRKTETGKTGPEAYDTMFGHNKIAPPLTQMTVNEAIAAGPRWTKLHRSSAAGAYQFMNATLKDLKRTLKLTGHEVLAPSFQDRLAVALLERRGWSKFLAGQMKFGEFAENLAKEWASFPVIWPSQGAHRFLERGQSYYAGDGLNKALIAPEVVEKLLDDVTGGMSASPPAPPKAPIPVETLSPADPAPSAPPMVMRVALALLVIVAVIGAILLHSRG